MTESVEIPVKRRLFREGVEVFKKRFEEERNYEIEKESPIFHLEVSDDPDDFTRKQIKYRIPVEQYKEPDLSQLNHWRRSQFKKKEGLVEGTFNWRNNFIHKGGLVELTYNYSLLSGFEGILHSYLCSIVPTEASSRFHLKNLGELFFRVTSKDCEHSQCKILRDEVIMLHSIIMETKDQPSTRKALSRAMATRVRFHDEIGLDPEDQDLLRVAGPIPKTGSEEERVIVEVEEGKMDPTRLLLCRLMAIQYVLSQRNYESLPQNLKLLQHLTASLEARQFTLSQLLKKMEKMTTLCTSTYLVLPTSIPSLLFTLLITVLNCLDGKNVLFFSVQQLDTLLLRQGTRAFITVDSQFIKETQLTSENSLQKIHEVFSQKNCSTAFAVSMVPKLCHFSLSICSLSNPLPKVMKQLLKKSSNFYPRLATWCKSCEMSLRKDEEFKELQTIILDSSSCISLPDSLRHRKILEKLQFRKRLRTSSEKMPMLQQEIRKPPLPPLLPISLLTLILFLVPLILSCLITTSHGLRLDGTDIHAREILRKNNSIQTHLLVEEVNLRIGTRCCSQVKMKKDSPYLMLSVQNQNCDVELFNNFEVIDKELYGNSYNSFVPPAAGVWCVRSCNKHYACENFELDEIVDYSYGVHPGIGNMAHVKISKAYEFMTWCFYFGTISLVCFLLNATITYLQTFWFFSMFTASLARSLRNLFKKPMTESLVVFMGAFSYACASNFSTLIPRSTTSWPQIKTFDLSQDYFYTWISEMVGSSIATSLVKAVLFVTLALIPLYIICALILWITAAQEKRFSPVMMAVLAVVAAPIVHGQFHLTACVATKQTMNKLFSDKCQLYYDPQFNQLDTSEEGLWNQFNLPDNMVVPAQSQPKDMPKNDINRTLISLDIKSFSYDEDIAGSYFDFIIQNSRRIFGLRNIYHQYPDVNTTKGVYESIRISPGVYGDILESCEVNFFGADAAYGNQWLEYTPKDMHIGGPMSYCLGECNTGKEIFDYYSSRFFTTPEILGDIIIENHDMYRYEGGLGALSWFLKSSRCSVAGKKALIRDGRKVYSIYIVAGGDWDILSTPYYTLDRINGKCPEKPEVALSLRSYMFGRLMGTNMLPEFGIRSGRTGYEWHFPHFTNKKLIVTTSTHSQDGHRGYLFCDKSIFQKSRESHEFDSEIFRKLFQHRNGANGLTDIFEYPYNSSVLISIYSAPNLIGEIATFPICASNAQNILVFGGFIIQKSVGISFHCKDQVYAIFNYNPLVVVVSVAENNRQQKSSVDGNRDIWRSDTNTDVFPPFIVFSNGGDMFILDSGNGIMELFYDKEDIDLSTPHYWFNAKLVRIANIVFLSNLIVPKKLEQKYIEFIDDFDFFSNKTEFYTKSTDVYIKYVLLPIPMDIRESSIKKHSYIQYGPELVWRFDDSSGIKGLIWHWVDACQYDDVISEWFCKYPQVYYMCFLITLTPFIIILALASLITCFTFCRMLIQLVTFRLKIPKIPGYDERSAKIPYSHRLIIKIGAFLNYHLVLFQMIFNISLYSLEAALAPFTLLFGGIYYLAVKGLRASGVKIGKKYIVWILYPLCLYTIRPVYAELDFPLTQIASSYHKYNTIISCSDNSSRVVCKSDSIIHERSTSFNYDNRDLYDVMRGAHNDVKFVENKIEIQPLYQNQWKQENCKMTSQGKKCTNLYKIDFSLSLDKGATLILRNPEGKNRRDDVVITIMDVTSRCTSTTEWYGQPYKIVTGSEPSACYYNGGENNPLRRNKQCESLKAWEGPAFEYHHEIRTHNWPSPWYACLFSYCYFLQGKMGAHCSIQNMINSPFACQCQLSCVGDGCTAGHCRTTAQCQFMKVNPEVPWLIHAFRLGTCTPKIRLRVDDPENDPQNIDITGVAGTINVPGFEGTYNLQYKQGFDSNSIFAAVIRNPISGAEPLTTTTYIVNPFTSKDDEPIKCRNSFGIEHFERNCQYNRDNGHLKVTEGEIDVNNLMDTKYTRVDAKQQTFISHINNGIEYITTSVDPDKLKIVNTDNALGYGGKWIDSAAAAKGLRSATLKFQVSQDGYLDGAIVASIFIKREMLIQKEDREVLQEKLDQLEFEAISCKGSFDKTGDLVIRFRITGELENIRYYAEVCGTEVSCVMYPPQTLKIGQIKELGLTTQTKETFVYIVINLEGLERKFAIRGCELQQKKDVENFNWEVTPIIEDFSKFWKSLGDLGSFTNFWKNLLNFPGRFVIMVVILLIVAIVVFIAVKTMFFQAIIGRIFSSGKKRKIL